MNAKTPVVIVDSHKVFADALSWRLNTEPDVEVVAVATTASAALQLIELHDPNVVIVDVGIENHGDGIDLARAIQDVHPQTRIIVVARHADATTAVRAVSAGARAFVPQDASSDEFLVALRGVVAGETRVPPLLLTAVIASLREANAEQNMWQVKLSRLTRRERDVLELMVGGMDRAAIAAMLFLSINTVRTHVKKILGKLGVHTSLEAVSVALRAGLRPPNHSDGVAP